MGNFHETKNVTWPITWKRDAKKTTKESMTDSCEIISPVGEWLRWRSLSWMGRSCRWRSHLSYVRRRPLSTRTTGGYLSISREMTPIQWENVLISNKHCLHWNVYTKTCIEFFLYHVAMARIMVVFLRTKRKSRKKKKANACDRSGQPVVYRTLAKKSDEWLSKIHFTFDSEIVYSWRRCVVTDKSVKTRLQKTRFRDVKYARIWEYRLSWRWQDKVGLQHPEERTLYLTRVWWNKVDL